jgi:hemolysin III
MSSTHEPEKVAAALPQLRRTYRRAELVADGTVHVVGLALGIGGAIWLVLMAPTLATMGERVAVAIYAVGLVCMLSASAAYNMWPLTPRKQWLRRLDHSAIYIMIAGTYSPFIAQIQNGWTSLTLFLGVWGAAISGLVMKLVMPSRFERLSILLYLALGWSGIGAYDSLGRALDHQTWLLLGVGGIIYSVGVGFHLREALPFHNVIWHVFVLAAAICHYFAVLGVL